MVEKTSFSKSAKEPVHFCSFLKSGPLYSVGGKPEDVL
jgi:hypothetical protein